MATLPYIFSPDGMTVIGANGTDNGTAKANLPRQATLRGLPQSSTTYTWNALISGLLYYTPGTAGVTYNFPSNASITIGLRVFHPGSGLNGGNPSSSTSFVVIGPDYRFRCYSPDEFRLYKGTTLLYTQTGVATGAYFEVSISPTAVTLYCNNVQVYTSAQTNAASTGLTWAESSTTVACRDLYISTTRLGEQKIRLGVPNTASGTGSVNTGTMAQALDLNTPASEVVCEDGQYAQTNFTTISDDPLTISVVQSAVVGRKTGTATLPEKIRVVTPAGTIDTDAEPLALGNSSQIKSWVVDPNDSTAWTKAKLSGLSIGVKG